ncbi:hypothetical protein CLCR_06310 [Cladophialophora carrionii]|uniref:Uncharacterized protein n=1 Tax=Cladophialophora carrionii TaxID=86049 RepID=A0A1C1CA64_9EURO|nr:hypothetical protein CLCR_06310 [Cladophialophora carrionii]
MGSVIESIPIVESSSSGLAEGHPPAEKKAAPSIDGSGSSNTSPNEDEDGDVARPGPPLQASQAHLRVSGNKHLASDTEAPLQSPPINEPAERASSADTHKSQIVQASILHILVMLMTHRLGVIATKHVQETQHSGQKIIALVAMFAATIMALLSGGKLEHGRALFAQGYRDLGGIRPPMNRSDPLVAFIVLSFFSLSIPWTRLLLAWCWAEY